MATKKTEKAQEIYEEAVQTEEVPVEVNPEIEKEYQAEADQEAQKPQKPAKKMVRIRLFRDNDKYKDAVYVAVNGESYMVPRGVEVEVPDYIAEVLQRSMDEDQKTAEMLKILEENYEG